MIKSTKPRPLSDPDAAARKLVEIANGVESTSNGSMGHFWRQAVVPISFSPVSSGL